MLKHTIVALAGMAAGLAGLSSGASAFPMQPAPGVGNTASPMLTEVRTHYDRGRTYNRTYNRAYNRHYDGMRCGNWSNHCRYHHGGYYYQNPWWLVPAVGAGIAIGAAGAYVANDGYYDGGYYGRGYGNRHVAWCLDRYRSYNPRSNTWVSYSGRVNQCISPYGP
jgi:hypothetical protein